MTRTVLHLIDDIPPGGETRMLHHLEESDRAEHIVQTAGPGAVEPMCRADMIVSHRALCWRSLPSLMALRAACPHTPIIHVEHAATERRMALQGGGGTRMRGLLRAAYALVDRVVAVSEAQAEWMRARHLVDPERLHVISPSTALEPFLALPPALSPPRVFGMMGRLCAQKGMDIGIAAFRSVEDPTLRLEIHGAGPDRAALEAAAAGDPRISFHGHAMNPAQAMGRLDAVLAPSRWEPFGLVALEARAAGRMLLVSDADGLRDHGAAGAQMVRGAGITPWTEAIAAAAAAPTPGFALARGRAAAARAETRFLAGWRGLVADLGAIPAPRPMLQMVQGAMA